MYIHRSVRPSIIVTLSGDLWISIKQCSNYSSPLATMLHTYDPGTTQKIRTYSVHMIWLCSWPCLSKCYCWWTVTIKPYSYLWNRTCPYWYLKVGCTVLNCCGHPAPCVSKVIIVLCICTWLGACGNVIMCADGGTARLGMPGAINPPHLKLTIWCTHKERERERESIVNAGMPTVPQHNVTS